MTLSYACQAALGLLLFLPVLATGQKPDLKKEAALRFANGKFRSALNDLEMLDRLKPGNETYQLQLGICYYHTNQLDKAEKYLGYLTENNGSEEACLYLARTHHARSRFREAVKFYKQFLRLAPPSHPLRRSVMDDIRRCASGQALAARTKSVLVENLGDQVNSTGDDFGPVPSPNNEDRLYFSSAREGNTGGLRDEKGLRDDLIGDWSSDMFVADVTDGEWKATRPLNALLNSPRHDVLLDFNSTGRILYFFKGFQLFSGEILVDTFKTNPDERNLFPPPFQSAMIPEEGDGTPFFVNDTTLLFASRRSGGYGGFDLYVSSVSNGIWSPARNLGPRINTAYDEVSPFLALDGRTLFFSSNNTRSMGGFDVFSSRFDDAKAEWQTPENLGAPINSPGDDLSFRLTKDGFRAFLASSRKEGLGERDIYQVIYKTMLETQSAPPNPVLFSLVMPPAPDTGASALVTPAPANEPARVAAYEFTPFYYNDDDDVLGNNNVRQLNRMAKMWSEFPQLKFVFTAHADDAAQPEYELYFSIKRAEKLADYLVKNGVKPAAITLKSCGSNYPVAQNTIQGEPNSAGRRMNRRIVPEIINLSNAPVRVTVERQDVNEAMASGAYDNFLDYQQGLSYKIQIAAIRQMYKGAAINKSDAMIEKLPETGLYHYTVGLFKTFKEAEQLSKELAAEGMPETFIVPYINGVRFAGKDLKPYLSVFPDLLQYQTYQKTRQ